MMNKKNIIYIYNDAGVGEESLNQILKMFSDIPGFTRNIQTINAEQIINKNWSINTSLFVMPGGADLPYAQKLNGAGNQKIIEYVKSGGSYLGLCAGAYYATSYIEFDKGGKLEVIGDRELKFFKGKAIGPALAPYDYDSENGSRVAKITTTFSDLPEATVYYNGGGYFENAENSENTEIIAYYQNEFPAIIRENYGEGTVILSGVHFEYNPYLLDSKDPHLQKIIPELIYNDTSRLMLIAHLLKILGV